MKGVFGSDGKSKTLPCHSGAGRWFPDRPWGRLRSMGAAAVAAGRFIDHEIVYPGRQPGATRTRADGAPDCTGSGHPQRRFTLDRAKRCEREMISQCLSARNPFSRAVTSLRMRR